jgi:antitoxin (DNA-binding transcriptional repressor) of toxin-antitoxin stability system
MLLFVVSSAPDLVALKTVTVHKAKTTLSQLIAAVEAGEEVIIMRDREPVVRLVAIGDPVPVRKFGALAGKVAVTDAFFEALPEDELAGWEQ